MKLTKAQARKWVRDHFADYIEQAEWAIDVPEGVEEIAADEQVKIVRRLRGSASRRVLEDGK